MKKNVIRNVVLISLIGNIILTALKLTFGLLGNAFSLMSDGINSLSDIFVSILILIVLKIANKKADKNHPYGHEKYEGVVYLILSFIIFVIGGFILISGITNLINYFNGTVAIIKPESYTVSISIIALIIKIFLFAINFSVAKKYHSNSLKGDANNHLVDILATAISLTSLIFAQFNILYFEPIASILISLFIIYTALSMAKEGISYLVDEAPTKETMTKLRNFILQIDGVLSVDDLKARKHMANFYVDVEIGVNNKLSLVDSHKIAESVHDQVEAEFRALHVMVHVNPYNEKSR